ncbi:LOW QUALITY PROTEIN: cyclic nucleotide-gated cation channel alpha-4 [Poecile atricapillus]|uniref:LOW QUALITY PROTEIN: cyclic nucleotide-gated cation channel alpha-4 n=1 Tax=Poecile atricapillus TaxID=48891 RepID=UPI002739A422|nr:LOW QUALITY PROTEIN: cyclic nucleotide-gated cation channel alpha-4 [Poecile atricapillus]
MTARCHPGRAGETRHGHHGQRMAASGGRLWMMSTPGKRSSVRGSPGGRQGPRCRCSGWDERLSQPGAAPGPGPRCRSLGHPLSRSHGDTGTPSCSEVTHGDPSMPRARAAYLGQGRGGPVPSAPHLGRAEEASDAGPGTPRDPAGRSGTGPLAPRHRDPLGPVPAAGPSPSIPLEPVRSLWPRAAKGGRRPGHPGTEHKGGAPRPLPLRPSAAAHRPPPPRAPRSRRHLPAAPDAPRALATPTTGGWESRHREPQYEHHREPGTALAPAPLCCEPQNWAPQTSPVPREPPGWVPLRSHAWHRGGRRLLPGARLHRTGGYRDARDPRCGGCGPSAPSPSLGGAGGTGTAGTPSATQVQGGLPEPQSHGQPGLNGGQRDPKWGWSDPRSLCAPSRTATPQNWTLDPAGDWHYRWISLMVLPILYNWVVLILRCCFPELQEAHTGLWQALDGLSDALYLLDIAVHCHTGFLEDGILVRDLSRTRRLYLSSWTFPWDVMSVLPTELLCLLPGVPRVPGVPAARANRCLRVPRLFEAFERCETRTGWPNVFRMAKLMLYLLLGIHWHGCLYFALSAHLGLGVDPWVCPSSTRALRRYLHSFYFSTLVLATVGDTPAPQREEEFLFLTAGFLVAVLGFATVTGSISTVIVNLSTATTALYRDAGPVRRYLRARGAGGRLAARVGRWQQHLRAQRKLPAERAVLQLLPRGLRAEVAAEVHLAALRRVGLFRSWEHGVLRQLVLRLRPQVFGPGEFVCRRGDVGREMYFIREGRLAVVAEDGVTQLAVLSEGLYFGEISLINIKGNTAGNRRTANILSIGYSDLFCLGKEDLAEVLAEFPCARAAMEAKGRELLLRMGRLDTGAEAAALAAEAEAERRLQGLELALEGLQTQAARLLAQLEASALRMALRVQRLEGRALLRDRAARTDGAAGAASPPAGTQGPAGGQRPPGAQHPAKAQRVLRACGPLREQGLSKVRGAPRAQGPQRAQAPSDMQGPPKAHGTPMVRGPLRPQRQTGARGPSGTYGPGGAQVLPRAQGPSGSQSSRGAHDLSGARTVGVPRGVGVPRD